MTAGDSDFVNVMYNFFFCVPFMKFPQQTA